MIPAPPDSDELPLASPKLRRRRWWIIGTVGLLFAAIVAMITFSDAPEPDVADLAPRRIEIPDAENFYVQLAKLAQTLSRDGIVPGSEPEDLPENHPERMPSWGTASDYHGFEDFLAAGRGWTPARLAQWDAPLAEFAHACEELLRLEKSQAPLPENFEDLYRDHRLSDIGTQLPAAAGLFWQAGDRRRALEILAVTYRCGARIKRSHGDLSRTYLRGSRLQRAALRGWQRFALADPATADPVAELWRACREPEAPGLFRETIRSEYHRMSLLIAANDAETLRSGSIRGSPAPTLFVQLARTRVLYPLVYKPNLTRALYAEQIRTVLPDAELDAASFRQRGHEKRPPLELRDLFRPINLYGRLILNDDDSTRWAARIRCSYLTEESLFETVLALRRYHTRHDELPPNLDALVPDFLDSVPLDHMDGAPLRYSRSDCAVWSIGTDGIGQPESPHPPKRQALNQLLDFAIAPNPAPLIPPPATPPTADDSPLPAASTSP